MSSDQFQSLPSAHVVSNRSGKGNRRLPFVRFAIFLGQAGKHAAIQIYIRPPTQASGDADAIAPRAFLCIAQSR